MDNNAQAPAAEHLIVDVKDHDINVPDDLGSNGMPFWKQEDMKIWLYVLGAAVLILIVVFALLSKQTSLFQGRTKLAMNTDTVAIDEGDTTDVDGFNSSAANDENLEGEGDFANNGGDDEGSSIDDYLPDDGGDDERSSDLPDEQTEDNSDGFNDGLDVLLDDTSDENTNDQFGGFDVYIPDEEPVITDPFGESDTFEGYAAASDTTDINSEITAPDYSPDLGPNLNSNTDQAVVISPTMQGDTGPVPIMAFIPSALYAMAHFRKRKI